LVLCLVVESLVIVPLVIEPLIGWVLWLGIVPLVLVLILVLVMDLISHLLLLGNHLLLS